MPTYNRIKSHSFSYTNKVQSGRAGNLAVINISTTWEEYVIQVTSLMRLAVQPSFLHLS